MAHPHDTPSMTLERLEQILAAYGAAPERWPDAERTPAQRLVVASPAARALHDDAARLDRLLSAAPVVPPSPMLVARVLAAAPRPRTTRAWRAAVFAAVPLAAAAAVTLWLAIDPQPARRHAALPAIALGEYASPTDVLLEPSSLGGVYSTVPAIGCADSVLGCPGVTPTAGRSHSQWQAVRRARA